MFSLCACVVAISIFLTCTIIIHSDELDSIYQKYVISDTYKNIYVYDCNGNGIYTGGFSDDEVVRLSTFHLIGDRNGSIPESILSENSSQMININKLKGYISEAKNITLSIDIRLQKSAYELLDNNGHNGCIIVADYSTGEIKAMVSTPSVDVYNTDYIQDGAFLNKASMSYPPGSVFKSVTVAALLEKKPSAKTFMFNCKGKSQHICCYDQKPHGTQNLASMLSNSCNCGISAVAKSFLTPDELNNFTEKTGMLDQVVSGMNITKGYINANDDFMWSANGQSKNMTTPLGVVAFYNTIANDGKKQPMFFNYENQCHEEPTQIMSSYTAKYIASALSQVTKDCNLRYECFAKTGTAELDNDESHSWFVCCLTDEAAPQYTVLVFIEHGGLSTLAKSLAVDYINNYILG